MENKGGKSNQGSVELQGLGGPTGHKTEWDEVIYSLHEFENVKIQNYTKTRAGQEQINSLRDLWQNWALSPY